jgi:tetratricopeptide (TPR) repeat protein
LCSLPEQLLGQAEYAARMHDVARSRALIGEALGTEGVSADDVDRARYFADSAASDWRAAIADTRAYVADLKVRNARLKSLEQSTYAIPLLAYALARAGDFSGAHREIDKSPGDCVACETARGNIDALEGKAVAATWWFARAIRDAPSIPFAYSDWGAELMAKGDLDAAIAEFKLANQKGPHFADPLEMWGEALMAKNRSDLALAKFEEAAKYAPNWGRLHLKWGEALFWAGKRDDAQKQFAVARGLDLDASDSAELTKLKISHG